MHHKAKQERLMLLILIAVEATWHITLHCQEVQPVKVLELCKKGLQARIGKCVGFRNDKRDLTSTCKKL